MNTRKTLAALVTAGTVAVAGCGDDDTSSGARAGGGNGTDRAFVAAMIPHHEGAIEMATIAQKRGESRFVKQLAADIVRTQSAEIAALRREDEGLDTAGIETGSLGVPKHAMGMDDDPAMLRAAKPFDRKFIEMMIPHHVGAIEMAKAELAKGGDPELKTMAQAIVDAQEDEIDRMREHLGQENGSSADENGAEKGH
jgi:uncharacterized protein (DUF305 family)